VVEEPDRVRVTAVLPADPELQAGLGLSAQPRTHLHELADSWRVDRLDGERSKIFISI